MDRIDRKTLKYRNQWVGLKVRTLKPLSNGWCSVAQGTICVVTRKWGALHLTSDACPCCGIKVHISRVKEYDVEIIGRADDDSTSC